MKSNFSQLRDLRVTWAPFLMPYLGWITAEKRVGKKPSISNSPVSLCLTTLRGEGFRTLRIKKGGEKIEQKEKKIEEGL